MKKVAWFCVLLIIFSCGGDSPEPVSDDAFSGFFPLQTGSFSIYDVDEIQYQQNVQTHSVYELKTIVADSFKNEEGGYTFVINRYKRTDSRKPWAVADTWSARVNDREVVVNEGSTSFVRLSQPLLIGQKWNGNELNALGGADRCGTEPTYSCDRYELTALWEAFEVGGKTFDNTLTVTEHNDPDLLVKYDVRKSVYSSSSGLVYVEKTVLNYCTTPPSCFGTQNVDTGYKYKQILKQHGIE